MDKFSVVVNGLGNVAVGCVQHQGAREQQEDSVGFTPVNGDPMDGFLAVVADGMGGMASGAFVSGWTVRRMLEAEIGRSGEAPEKELCEAARRISGEIAAGGSRGGSTMAAVYLDGAGVHICSVGDSRVYMQRGGVLTRLTEDGDYMSNLLDRVIGGELTFQQAAEDPERDSLTQFMGGGVNIQPDATRAPIRPESGDRLLICSDGVYNAVNEQTLLQSLTLSAAAAAEDILGRVLAKGYANQDNITAAVLEFREITHEPHADEPETSENSGGIAVKLRADCTYYTSAGGSDHNEDSVYCGRGIYAAADGLGGHSGGAAASQAAVNYIANAAKRSGGVLEVGMAELFEGANTAVRKLGGGLTTIAAGALREGKFILGNVGDSRVYYFRNGRVIAQTRDHSVCQAAVELGQLTPEQIRGSEDRVKLLKVLGNFDRLELKRQPEQISAMNGDAFLICTDGFWEHVHEREMECDLVKSDSPTEWRDRMLKRLLLRTGNSGDNYTALCGFITDEPENPAPRKKPRRFVRFLISAAAALLMIGGLIAALVFLSGDSGAEESSSSLADTIRQTKITRVSETKRALKMRH